MRSTVPSAFHVANLAAGMCERAPPPTSAAFRWQQWLHQLPLRVGQVRVIAASASMITHPPNMITLRQDPREDTPSPINFPDTL